MALRKIALQGEECLTKVCRPVTEFNDRLHTLLDDMAETLEEAGGVGLAAPQVGILRRVCIVLNEDDEIIEAEDDDRLELDDKLDMDDDNFEEILSDDFGDFGLLDDDDL